MQDSIYMYHMTLKSHLICNFRTNTSRFCHKKRQSFLDVNTYRYQVICILNLVVDYCF